MMKLIEVLFVDVEHPELDYIQGALWEVFDLNCFAFRQNYSM